MLVVAVKLLVGEVGRIKRQHEIVRDIVGDLQVEALLRTIVYTERIGEERRLVVMEEVVTLDIGETDGIFRLFVSQHDTVRRI